MSAKAKSTPPSSPAPVEPPPKPKSQKKLLMIVGIILLVLLLLSAVVYGLTRPDSPTKQSAIVAKPARTIEQTGAFKLQPATAGNCSALLPAGWPSPTTNDTSTTFDATSPDKAMYAGYGHQAINTQLAPYAGAYTYPLNDPNLYSSDPAVVALAYTKIIVGNLGGDPDTTAYTTVYNEAIGDYQLRSVASGSHAGVVFFHRAGFPGDGRTHSYSVPLYFAIATNSAWPANGLSLAKIAASIKCQAQLVARDSGPDFETSSSADHSTSEDPNGDDDGYNPQLGTEYVHDPNTKENYLVDPSRDWSSDGPNGGGYYKQNGNDYTQLEAGRSD